MPIYEYGCNKCGCEFEELTNDMELMPQCPQCGSSDTYKLMSLCARTGSKKASDSMSSASGSGCGSCSGGNCSSCCGR